MRRAHRIGILYSTSGPYAAIGRDCVDAAQSTISRYSTVMPGLVEPVHIDPGGNLKGYVEGAITMLRDVGCRHIIGAVTSAARKEIIPLIEKHDGLLWYTCPYEGFETNPNVIYTGACPNQHLLPLFDYLLPRFGNRPYLAGANYVWGWEMNRLARELIDASGGEIVGERCLPIEETSVDLLIEDIERGKPDFVLNSLLGPANYAFLEAVHHLAGRNAAFAPDRCPVVSCGLTECELGNLKDDVAVGQMSAACCFDGMQSLCGAELFQDLVRHFDSGRRISSIFATTHAAMALCIEAIHAIGGDEPQAVRQQLYSTTTQTILGPIRIDARTNHAALPFHLGRINNSRRFDVIASRPTIVADPYLTSQRNVAKPRLRLLP